MKKVIKYSTPIILMGLLTGCAIFEPAIQHETLTIDEAMGYVDKYCNSPLEISKRITSHVETIFTRDAKDLTLNKSSSDSGDKIETFEIDFDLLRFTYKSNDIEIKNGETKRDTLFTTYGYIDGANIIEATIDEDGNKTYISIPYINKGQTPYEAFINFFDDIGYYAGEYFTYFASNLYNHMGEVYGFYTDLNNPVTSEIEDENNINPSNEIATLTLDLKGDKTNNFLIHDTMKSEYEDEESKGYFALDTVYQIKDNLPARMDMIKSTNEEVPNKSSITTSIGGKSSISYNSKDEVELPDLTSFTKVERS